MSPADIASGLLNICGGLIALGFLAGGVATAALVVRHRRVHQRLGLASTGHFLACPMCTDERERRELPLAVRFSRDLKRKRYQAEEFDTSGRD